MYVAKCFFAATLCCTSFEWKPQEETQVFGYPYYTYHAPAPCHHTLFNPQSRNQAELHRRDTEPWSVAELKPNGPLGPFQYIMTLVSFVRLDPRKRRFSGWLPFKRQNHKGVPQNLMTHMGVSCFHGTLCLCFQKEPPQENHRFGGPTLITTPPNGGVKSWKQLTPMCNVATPWRPEKPGLLSFPLIGGLDWWLGE